MEFSKLHDVLMMKDGVTESFPFDDQTLVYKVGGKMFALISLDSNPLRMNLKCDPERAEILREAYENITPGYHMNKKHWNSLVMDGVLNENLVLDLIQHSYDLVVASLPKAQRNILFKNNEIH